VAIVVLAARLFQNRHSVPTAQLSDPAQVESDAVPAPAKVKADLQVVKPTGATSWRQWVDQLRAAGVPNRLLAKLVLADFEERWQKREDEFQRKYARGEADLDEMPLLVDDRDREQERELR